MAYTTAEARQRVLDSVAEATNEIGRALAALGAAYEQLDERSGDELEEQLFGPVQAAFGRAQRTHAEFAARSDLAGVRFEAQRPRVASTGAKGFIEEAVQAAGSADATLAELQDSMLPIEVGDPQLRAMLSEVRELLGGLSQRARTLVRTLGR
jgi:hypothetical protein